MPHGLLEAAMGARWCVGLSALGIGTAGTVAYTDPSVLKNLGFLGFALLCCTVLSVAVRYLYNQQQLQQQQAMALTETVIRAAQGATDAMQAQNCLSVEIKDALNKHSAAVDKMVDHCKAVRQGG